MDGIGLGFFRAAAFLGGFVSPARFGLLIKPVRILKIWMERRRQLRALATLDDRLLDDLGLRHEQVRGEAAKPFWKGMRLSEFGPNE
jgi:uncharacterized protein YjiS (DUF1127 family)